MGEKDTEIPSEVTNLAVFEDQQKQLHVLKREKMTSEHISEPYIFNSWFYFFEDFPSFPLFFFLPMFLGMRQMGRMYLRSFLCRWSDASWKYA